MKGRKGKLVACVVVFSVLWAGVCCAESRIWTSKKGDTIDAEYIKIFGNKVILKTSDGKNLKVPVAGLCAADQSYLASVVPPVIEISVDVDLNRDSEYSSENYDRKSEAVKCSVVLEKTNKEPCSRKFSVHIYVFAKKEKGDTRWLISHVKESASFESEKSVQFKTPSATVQYIKSLYSDSRGFRYEGYLVVVEDDAGQVVAMESNQGKYEKNWSKIKGASKGAQFDRDFDKTGEIRDTSLGAAYL